MFRRQGYTFVLYIIAPLLLLRFLWRSRNNPNYRRRLNERFGFFRETPKPGGVHFHLVSVGETLAALPIIEYVLAEHPDIPVYVTCTTPSGSSEILKRLGDRVFHVYLPFDFPFAMERFYRTLSPCCTLLMETEMWPNMLHVAAKYRAKVMILNARISDRSMRGYRCFGRLTEQMINCISVICCQDEKKAKCFIDLGADPNKVKVTGNLKFDMEPPTDLGKNGQLIRKAIGDRPVWVAGSTHPGEELMLLEAHKKVLATFPDAVLILAPRHMERFHKVEGIIKKFGLSYSKRSDTFRYAAESSVVLGDSLGELLEMYHASDVAFVGGSLVELGGHNPIEPAVADTAVITGPHFSNFSHVYEILQNCSGVMIASDHRHVANIVVKFFSNPLKVQSQATRAKQEIAKHRGALQKTITCLNELLNLEQTMDAVEIQKLAHRQIRPLVQHKQAG